MLYYNRLFTFLESNNVINPNQFGFQKGKNTTLAVFKTLRQVWEEINNNKPGIALFLDLSKAFDCVVHTILLDKLEEVGIRGEALSLMQSYLDDRSQSTVIDTYNKNTKTIERIESGFKNIQLGVPQGSVLGPLLFLIYINNLPNITNHICVMFADDATIFIPQESNDIVQFETEINNTLSKIVDWLGSINLRVNIDKTKFLRFRHYRTPSLNLNIIHNNNTVNEVNEINFLGIKIDANLNWKSHIIKVNQKISKYCYAISTLSHISSTSIAKSTYYGHVFPHLCYGVIFWGNSVNAKTVFIMQKKCIRAIYNMKNTESLRPIFKQNNLLTLTDIFILEICLFVKNNAMYFSKKSSRTDNLRSKHKYNIPIPQINNTIFYKSTYYTAIKIYNKLPTDLKELNGNFFKLKLRRWLINKAHYTLEEYLL